MKKILLFNKASGELFGTFDLDGFKPDGFDDSLFVTKEIEMGDGEFWYGNFTAGRLYDQSQITLVSQQQLRDDTINKIFSKYFFIDQIKIITEQLKASVNEENQIKDFKEMVGFIEECKKEYHLKKEAFSSNPEVFLWVSDEEASKQVENRYQNFL